MYCIGASSQTIQSLGVHFTSVAVTSEESSEAFPISMRDMAKLRTLIVARPCCLGCLIHQQQSKLIITFELEIVLTVELLVDGRWQTKGWIGGANLIVGYCNQSLWGFHNFGFSRYFFTVNSATPFMWLVSVIHRPKLLYHETYTASIIAASTLVHIL